MIAPSRHRQPVPSFVLAALLAATVASASTASRGRLLRGEPKETAIIAGAELGGLLGWSPMPTQAPMGPPVDLELARRYDKGSDTCGFADGYKSDPWTCYALGATCSVWSDYLGCCATTGVCSSTMITACYDWTAVQAGACNTADLHTLCCSDQMPSCWEWQSTTSTNPDLTVTAYNCQANGGTGTLWEAPPILTATSSGASTVPDPTNTAVTDDSIETTIPDSGGSGGAGSDAAPGLSSGDGDKNKSKSSNVGAIVGGVVGGLALLAIIGVVAAMLIWNRRRGGKPSDPNAAAAAQPMMQAGQDGMILPPPNSYYNLQQQQQNQQHHQNQQTPPVGGYYDPLKTPGSSPGPYTPNMYPSPMTGPAPFAGGQMGGGGYTQVPGQMAPAHWSTELPAQPPAPQELAVSSAETRIGTAHNRAELS